MSGLSTSIKKLSSDLGILLVAKTDAGDAKFSRRYRRAVVLAHEVKLATRRLIRAEAARIIEQIDRESDNGGTRREIVIEWSMQTRSIADQIKALDRAVRSKSQYKIEAAWFGINPHAHEYLAAGYEIARRAGKFKNFSGELEVTAQLIPVRIPSPELLRLYLPDAVRAAACPSSGFLGQLRV